MKIIVNKFGGGILKKELIPFIEQRLKEEIASGYSPFVIVSALPGTTDELIHILTELKKKKNYEKTIRPILNKIKEKHNQTLMDLDLAENYRLKATKLLIQNFTELENKLKNLKNTEIQNKTEDMVIAYGERLSSYLFSVYLENLNLESEVFLAEDLKILTDENFKNANILYKTSEKNVQKKLKNINLIPIIPGFTGITKNGDTTTLGRGGTDTTACFIGAAIRAEKIILWKDVGGVLSADPRIVKQARTIPSVSYQEAEEAGKIIHDKAIQYAKMWNTPIEITSLAKPNQKTIVGKPNTNKKTKMQTKIIGYKKNLVLFIVTDEYKKENDMLSITSNAFFKNKVDIILISNTKYSLQIVADNANGKADTVYEEIAKKVSKVETFPVSMIYLVGNFDVKDVNEFNNFLTKIKVDMEISAFLYKDCTRLEAIIKTKSQEELEKIIKSLHKKFIPVYPAKRDKAGRAK